MSRSSYTAVCRRVGDWWAIDVAELRGVHTQAKRLDQVEGMAREAIALLRDVSPDSFAVVVDLHLDGAAEKTILAATEATARARQAAEEAARLQRTAAEALVADYRLTVRDAGQLLKVSPQRISQLATRKVAGKATAATRKKAASRRRSTA
jgi:hypothetical protein